MNWYLYYTKYNIKIIKIEKMNRVYSLTIHLFICVGTNIHYSLSAICCRYFVSVTLV